MDTRLAYRREIDGLRAIAVLAVVLYHADARLMPGGFVGVDIFFVISGYLIGALLLKEWRETGRIAFAAFYARRLRRLMPAMWVMVAGSLVLALLVLPRTDGSLVDLIYSAVASLLYLSNFYFQFETGGYFDGPADAKPLLHLWSLGVEEQFYLVYPAILLVALRFFPRAWLPWVIAVLAAASLALAEYWLARSPGTAFFQMPARFWELAAGVGISATQFRLAPRQAEALATLGLAAIAFAIVMTAAGGHFPGRGAVPAVAGAFMVLCAIHGAPAIGWPGRLLNAGPMVFVGLCSYSFYLWHWPLLALDTATSLEPSHLAFRLALCAIALALAWLSLRFVEQPWRRGTLAPVRVLKATGGITALLLFLAIGLTRLPLSDEAGAQSVARAANDRPNLAAGCHHDATEQVRGLAPAACQSRPDAQAEVVLWGDSHAMAWRPFADALGNAVGHTMDACPPVVGFDGHRSDYPTHRENCRRFNDLVLERLAEGKTDTLVIAARWPTHFGADMQSLSERDRPVSPDARPAAPDDLGAGLRLAIERLAPKVRRVIVLGPIPVLRHEAPKCMALGRTTECAMSRDRFEALAADSWRRLAAATAGFDNVTLVDPADFFCDERDCRVTREDYALYWDDDHVSSTAARAFSADWTQARYRRAAAPAADGAAVNSR